MKSLLIFLAALAALLVGCVLVLWLRSPGSFSPEPLPAPNGYTNLLQAAKGLVGETPGGDSTNWAAIQYYTEKNQPHLRQARAALEQSFQVPLESTEIYLALHLPEISRLKAAAQALALQGRLASHEDRWLEAASNYVDIVRLGYKMSEGGVILDKMVGVACEAIGLGQLEQWLPATPVKGGLGPLLALLESVSTNGQAQVESVIRREKVFASEVYGWRGRLVSLVNHRSLQDAIDRTRQKSLQTELRKRRLLLRLAQHAFALERGQPPTSAADLVPTCLKAIPLDPETGKSLELSR